METEIYHKYSDFLKEKHGAKTYKLPINLPLTCPNRDGYLDDQGCYYCGEEAAGFENSPGEAIREQMLELKDHIAERYNAKKFIAYFQNFTTTYQPLTPLQKNIEKALTVEEVVEVALSTRPDCVNDKYLRGIKKTINSSNNDIDLTLELGLQSVNYHTLKQANRRHTLAHFIDAVKTAKRWGFEVGAHLILNLPGDNNVDVKENARILSALEIDTVKLHALYLREGTEFARRFQQGELEIISQKEYIDRVITFLELLDPRIAVQRLLGRAPEAGSVFVNWGEDNRQIHQQIIRKMKELDTCQGRKFDYLQGRCLQKFSEE